MRCLDIADFLDDSTHVLLQQPAHVQQKTVEKAIKEGICPILEQADLNIISLHATHLCAGIPVFPCSSESVGAVKPDIFLTLFDDVYACKAKLESDGYPFSTSQLLIWRQIECGIVDHFAQVCGVDNVYLAAKHPRITVYWRIFEPKRPRIYSASQITESRKSQELIDEIEEHRRQLHKKYIVFDPFTLDDRLLINNIPSDKKHEDVLEFNQEERLPCDLSDLGKDYLSLVVQDKALFPFQIQVREAWELQRPVEKNRRRNIIDAQIEYRDYRYIRQSDVVSAYRPWLNKHESSGVAAEKVYAAGSGRRTVVEYSLPKDLEDAFSKPFNTPLPGPLCTKLDNFYKKLSKEANREAKKRYERDKKKYAKFERFCDTFSRARPRIPIIDKPKPRSASMARRTIRNLKNFFVR